MAPENWLSGGTTELQGFEYRPWQLRANYAVLQSIGYPSSDVLSKMIPTCQTYVADVEHLRFLLLLFRYDGVGVLSSGRYNANSGQAEF